MTDRPDSPAVSFRTRRAPDFKRVAIDPYEVNTFQRSGLASDSVGIRRIDYCSSSPFGS